jgi:predicted CoA-substrate-specific enzyme activase
MIVAGVDIGAATSKAVILSDRGFMGSAVIPTGHSVVAAAEAVLAEALTNSRLGPEKLELTISTGYGRQAVACAARYVTEILCHAAGAGSVIPGARTVIDIGGQDSKVIQLDGQGRVLDFVMNDKCAAGTGRFLEVMAGVLGLKIDELGPAALRSAHPAAISSVCTVFAESEIVSLRAERVPVEDLVAGLHQAIARRVAALGAGVGFQREVVATGGVARNPGLVRALETELGLAIVVPPNPQLMGALGAAILARRDLADGP